MAQQPGMVIRVAANIAELKKNLAEGKAQIETTTAAMQKMASSLDGNKLIQQAHNITAAVNSIGGASKLTEAEKARLNATLDRAIQKYQALGQQAPPAMQALYNETKRVQSGTEGVGASTDTLMGKLKGLAGTLGLAFGGAAILGGLKTLAANTLNYASTIDDISKKLSVSAEATQRYKFAAEQTGASIEQVGKSVLKLSMGLSGGDKAVVEALDLAGLSFASIRAMKPEAAFDATVAAIAKMPNPMDQARVAMDLFGKSGAELLPAIREGFADIADSADTMSDETVKRLADAEDAWARLGTKVTIVSGEIISGVASFMGAVATIRPDMDQAAGAMTSGFSAAKVAVGDTTTESQKFAAEMAALKASLPGLVGGIASPFSNLGLVLDNTAKSKALFDQAMLDMVAQVESEKAARRLAESFQKQVDVLTGKALTREVAELARQVKAAGGAAGVAVSAYGQLSAKLQEFKSKGVVLRGDLALLDKATTFVSRTFVDLSKSVAGSVAAVRGISLVPFGRTGERAGWSFSQGFSDGIDLRTIEHELEDIARRQVKWAWSGGQAAGWSFSQGFGEGLGDNPAFNLEGLLGQGGKDAAKGFADSLQQSLANLPSVISGALQSGGNVMLAAFGSVAADLGSHFSKQFAAKASEGLSANMGALTSGAYAGLAAYLAWLVPEIVKSFEGVKRALTSTEERLKALEERFRSLGAAGQAAAAALQAAIAQAFSAAGRAVPRGDMEHLLSIFEQFKTKLELDKIAAQWKAAYDAMLASGQYTAATLTEVWRRYQEAMKEAAGEVDGRPEGARGFPTKAQLDKAAKDAEAAYIYMRDSGLYTADVLQQAWQQWQDALVESGNQASKLLRDIDAEMKTLQESIANEAPEEVMGVIEAQARARLEALEAEKAKALEVVKAQTSAEQEAAEVAEQSAQGAYARAVKDAKGLDDYLRELFSRGYQIPINWTTPGAPTQSGATFGGAMAEGGTGVVTRPTWFLAGEAGPESYQFKPLGRPGSSSSSGVQITINHPVVRQESDITRLTDEIVRRIPSRLALAGL